MCRIYGLLANEPTKVECTLVHAQNALLHQSRGDLRGESHSDGWGISCYPNSMPITERRAKAAHEDVWFSTTAERVYSHAVIAHVRQATVGGASLVNTHPFTHGYWTFAHNGTAQGFGQVEARLTDQTIPTLLRERRGDTDSELIFYWLLSRMEQGDISSQAHCHQKQRLVDVVREAITVLAKWCHEAGAVKPAKLNFLLTDGRLLLASRWNNSLHWIERPGVHDCEVCGIPHVRHDSAMEYRAVVVASEPISHEPWRAVPEHSILIVDEQVNLEMCGVE